MSSTKPPTCRSASPSSKSVERGTQRGPATLSDTEGGRTAGGGQAATRLCSCSFVPKLRRAEGIPQTPGGVRHRELEEELPHAEDFVLPREGWMVSRSKRRMALG